MGSRCQIVVCLGAQIPRDSSSSAAPCSERMGKSQSKMTEEDFAFVVKHSTLGPGEIKAWYDEFIAECPDGKINKEKFIAMYSIVAVANADLSDPSKMFDAFDIDRTGSLSFRELMMALQVVAPLCAEEKLEHLFNEIDNDGNGSLSFKEIKKMISALKTQVIFEKFDKNNDGIVTKEEFVSVLKEDKDIVEVLQRTYN